MRNVTFWFSDGTNLVFGLAEEIELQINKGLTHKQVLLRNASLGTNVGLAELEVKLNTNMLKTLAVTKITYDNVVSFDNIAVISVEYRIVSTPKSSDNYEEVAVLF